MIVLENNRNTIANLGCKEGHMLSLTPNGRKEITAELAELFEDEITSYVENGIVSLITKKKAPVVKDSFEPPKPTTKKRAKRTKLSKE